MNLIATSWPVCLRRARYTLPKEPSPRVFTIVYWPSRWLALISRLLFLCPSPAVELVAARVPGQLVYYRMLQETTWALIEEAFSAQVVVPNVTTTEASAAPVVVTSSE